MRDFRMGCNTTEHYTSLEEMRVAWGCKPIIKKNKNEDVLKKQQEQFLSKHKCPACNQPMSWVTGSVMACKNENCRGVKHEREDKEGNKIVTYSTAYELLDSKGSEIALNIFS